MEFQVLKCVFTETVYAENVHTHHQIWELHQCCLILELFFLFYFVRATLSNLFSCFAFVVGAADVTLLTRFQNKYTHLVI